MQIKKEKHQILYLHLPKLMHLLIRCFRGLHSFFWRNSCLPISRNKTFFLQIIMFLYCYIKVDHHLTCSKYFCSFLSTRYTPRNPHFVAEILIDPAISKS